MFRNIGAPEIILILLLVIVLFGAKKLPETARGLGRSLRIFKAETKGLRDDEQTPDATDEPARREAPRDAPREVTGRLVEDHPGRTDPRIADPDGQLRGPAATGER